MEEIEKTIPAPTKTIKRKTLKDLFNEPCAFVVKRCHVHQASELPGTTQNTLSVGRPGLASLSMVYHPGYGLIGHMVGKKEKEEYFLVPHANCSSVRE
jgi:hypothetical protein